MNTLLPYLSIVATSRNDDHGGDPLIRTQIFINCLARQCEKYKLPAELIIVDWNPVADRPGLAAVLDQPAGSTFFHAKVITVPAALHQQIKYSDKLQLFQMIAKNVGIRRSRGKFVLATNIDIIFSDELMNFIAQQNLDPANQYRVDRYDIHSGLSIDLSLDETLDYAWANPIRVNRRYQPADLVKHLYKDELFKRVCEPDPDFHEFNQSVKITQEGGVWKLHPDRNVQMEYLHTNACGDFTLLSKEGWEDIRGYPEFEAFSFNIDSMGVIAAHYAGYTEVALLPPHVCFHIEHGVGSGWTPEGESKLFNRLRQMEILNPEWSVLTPLVNEMRENKRSHEFNYSGWGMANFELPEQSLGDCSAFSNQVESGLREQAHIMRVTAIRQEYDLDRLTLAHERRELADLGLTDDIQRVQVFLPDEIGNYHEANSIVQKCLCPFSAKFEFKLDEFPCQFPLRLDPCESSGNIDIDYIALIDMKKNKLIMKIDKNNAHRLSVGGTSAIIAPKRSNKITSLYRKSPGKNGIRLISSGCDPQIYLPPISDNIGFPLVLIIEMKFTPATTV